MTGADIRLPRNWQELIAAGAKELGYDASD
jgi:hypothetical protein